MHTSVLSRASLGRLDQGGLPMLARASLGRLRSGGGGGSNDPHKYGVYRKPRLGFGGGIAALNARARDVKRELDENPALRKEVFEAVRDAAHNTGVNFLDVNESTVRSKRFTRIAESQISIEPDAVSIDEIIRWFEWVQIMEDEEDIALLLLLT